MDKIKYVLIIISCFLFTACKENYGDKKPTINIKVLPHESTVKIGKTRQFTATITSAENTSVTWVVEEEGGGTINSSGVYTAPQTLGTYHIRATSVAYPEKSDRVAVTVIPLEFAKVRVLNASSDAPKLNVWFYEAKVAENIDYAKSTEYIPILEGIHSFSMEGVIPGGNSTLFELADIDLLPNTNYDLVAVGNVADGEMMVVKDVSDFTSPADKLRIRFAHMSPATPEINVYLTAPEADLADAEPIGVMKYKESLGAIERDDSNFRIRLTLMDDTLIFDSRTLAYSVGADLIIGVVPNVGVGDSPVSLAFSGYTESDISSGGAVQIVHVSPGSPGLDIANYGEGAPFISNLGFLEETGYLIKGETCCSFNIMATGTTEPILNDPSFTLRNGNAITMLLTQNLGAATFMDDIRPVSTSAKVRAINATSLEDFVEFYAVPEDGSISEATPVDIHYWGDENYNYLAAGDYDLVVVSADTEAVLAEIPITVANGDIYTYVLHEAPGGGQPLGIITLDGTVP